MSDKKIKNIPYHLGIIMDGNRRWARKRGLLSLEGHRKGYEVAKKVGSWCKDRGVKVLTLWAFSTENWGRSKREIECLVRLLKHALGKKEVKRFNKEGIKLRVIGQRERFSKEIQKAIAKAEEATRKNKEGVLNLALSYGGKAEIIEAVRNIVKKKISPQKITEETIEENLWTKDIPRPDLIIRTSGEYRTSGFLLWKAAYSELYFCQKHWPDFSEKDLDDALADYAHRQRRFGQ